MSYKYKLKNDLPIFGNEIGNKYVTNMSVCMYLKSKKHKPSQSLNK